MKLSVKVRIKDKSTFGTLSEMAEEMSQAERSLYRRMLVDPEYAEYKPEFSKLHGITSRQFNALRMSVEGRLEARKASIVREHDNVAAKLASAVKIIEKIKEERKAGTKTKQNAFILHQKKQTCSTRTKHWQQTSKLAPGDSVLAVGSCSTLSTIWPRTGLLTTKNGSSLGGRREVASLWWSGPRGNPSATRAVNSSLTPPAKAF